MHIQIDDLTGEEIKTLLNTHLATMAEHSPPESCHALDLEGLRSAEVTFWTVWEDEELFGCGALKEIGSNQGEVKSMHTPAKFRGKGVAALLLAKIIDTAKERNLSRISLETGSMEAFAPAKALYHRFGFVECLPFGDYKVDPNSIYMCLDL